MRALLLGLAAALACLAAWQWLGANPDIVYLSAHGDAHWVRVDRQIELDAKDASLVVADFRRRWIASADVSQASLALQSLRVAVVAIDGRPIYSTGNDPRAWKTEHVVPLGGLVAPGPHELLIRVANRGGPPLLRVSAPELGVDSDARWEAMEPGGAWRAAVPVEDSADSSLARQFPRSDSALRSRIAALLAAFLAGAFAAYWRPHPQAEDAGRLRWLLMFAWTALCVSNLFRLPDYLGADAQAHIEYIRFIVEHGRLPLANEGWQMFQSPLYYLVSAAALSLLEPGLGASLALRLLRLLPYACGLLQIELGLRAARTVFPDRVDLHLAGTWFVALLPLNLYMSQYPGNEPLAACISAVVVLLLLRILCEPGRAASRKNQWVIGALLGLALLTKLSAALLLVAVALGGALALRSAGAAPRAVLAAAMRVGGAVLLVCGWYFARNIALMGHPFVGGWDPAGPFAWWQEPGFRIFEHFARFGTALVYPIYSGVHSFWDGFYSQFWLDAQLGSMIVYELRPPWHYEYLLSCALLGLPMTAVLLWGLLAALRRPWRAPLFFCAATVLGFVAAMLWIYLASPAFSNAKPSYTLGLLPCWVVLFCRGLEPLAKRPRARVLASGVLAAWGVFCYAGYFI